MIVHDHNRIEILDRSSIGEARRVSTRMAERSKLGKTQVGNVSLIVTELATNLFMHATGGEILLRMLPAESGPGIEIVAIDKGPGIADVPACMTDGYSNGGTRGCGLGAVRRLSSHFDIYSSAPAGTAVLSRVRDKRAPPHIELSAIKVPAPGESECGDAWHAKRSVDRSSIVVVDGLGHGPLAAMAAARAIATFAEQDFDTPAEYIKAAHTAMHSTRGAAIGAVEIDLQQRKIRFAGIGNIASRIVSIGTSRQQSLVSHGGIVGAELRKVQQFEYAWQDGDLLIMHSDGMNERWKLSDYPGLGQADAAIVGAILYRDAKRGRDDATVVVARLKAS